MLEFHDDGTLLTASGLTRRRLRLLLVAVVAATLTFNVHSPTKSLAPNTVKPAAFSNAGWCANGSYNLASLTCGAAANEATVLPCNWLSGGDGNDDNNNCNEEGDYYLTPDSCNGCDWDVNNGSNETSIIGQPASEGFDALGANQDYAGCCDTAPPGNVQRTADGGDPDGDYGIWENDGDGAYDATGSPEAAEWYVGEPNGDGDAGDDATCGGGDSGYENDSDANFFDGWFYYDGCGQVSISYTDGCDQIGVDPDGESGGGDPCGGAGGYADGAGYDQFGYWQAGGGDYNGNPDPDNDSDGTGENDGDGTRDIWAMPNNPETSGDSCSFACDSDSDGDANNETDAAVCAGCDYGTYAADGGCPSGDRYACALVGQNASNYIWASNTGGGAAFSYYAGLVASYYNGHPIYYYCVDPSKLQTSTGLDTENYHYGADNRVFYIAEYYGWQGGASPAQVAMYAGAQAAIWHFLSGSNFTFFAIGSLSGPSTQNWYNSIVNAAQSAINGGWTPYTTYADQYHLDAPSGTGGLPPSTIIAGGTSTITYHSTYPDGTGKAGDGFTLYISPNGAGPGASFSGASSVHLVTNAAGLATATLTANTAGTVTITALSDNGNSLNSGFWATNSAGGNQRMIEASVDPHYDEQNAQNTNLTVVPPANPDFTETLTSSSFGGTSCGNAGWNTPDRFGVLHPATTVCANPGDSLNWNMTYSNTGAGSTNITGSITSAFGGCDTLSYQAAPCGQFESTLSNRNGTTTAGNGCPAASFAIPSSPGSWCTNILPPGTSASNSLTAVVPNPYDSTNSSNQTTICNNPTYTYGYTNNGTLSGSMPIDREVCASTTYTTNMGIAKSANTPCATLGTATWTNFMTVGAAAALNPGQGDQACGSVTNLNATSPPIVYTISVSNTGAANRNLNGFTVTDNLTGNLAFLFGVPITCNAPNPLCSGPQAFVPSTKVGGENFPGSAPGAPFNCAGGDWCYFMQGTVTGPVATPCNGSATCWLWADFNPTTRALNINCIDTPPSVYSCDLPAGDTMSIGLNSDLVYNYTYGAQPAAALPSPAYLDNQINHVVYGGAPICPLDLRPGACISPGTSDRPGTPAVNMANSVTVSAPDASGAVTSNPAANSQLFLQCPQPLPGIVFANLPGTVSSNQTTRVTVDLVNWYLDSMQGLTSQQGDPALGMAIAGAKITAPADGTFANATIMSTSGGSVANIDLANTNATQISVNLTSMAATPTAGTPFTDVVVAFDLHFGVIPAGTPTETTNGYITTFDTSFPSCGYPASGGIAPIATNSSNSEDPGDPGIVGASQSSATSFVTVPPPSE